MEHLLSTKKKLVYGLSHYKSFTNIYIFLDLKPLNSLQFNLVYLFMMVSYYYLGTFNLLQLNPFLHYNAFPCSPLAIYKPYFQ